MGLGRVPLWRGEAAVAAGAGVGAAAAVPLCAGVDGTDAFGDRADGDGIMGDRAASSDGSSKADIRGQGGTGREGNSGRARVQKITNAIRAHQLGCVRMDRVGMWPPRRSPRGSRMRSATMSGSCKGQRLIACHMPRLGCLFRGLLLLPSSPLLRRSRYLLWLC